VVRDRDLHHGWWRHGPCRYGSRACQACGASDPMTNSQRPSAIAPDGIWQTAAASSIAWRMLTPARRSWAAIERAIAFATAPVNADSRDRLVERVVGASGLARTADRWLGEVIRAGRHS